VGTGKAQGPYRLPTRVRSLFPGPCYSGLVAGEADDKVADWTASGDPARLGTGGQSGWAARAWWRVLVRDGCAWGEGAQTAAVVRGVA